MKFTAPPQWPSPPDGWLPDPGWQPDPSWPPAPAGWQFWRNDHGVPLDGPAGLYGGPTPRPTWTRRAALGGATLLALLFGVGLGAAGDSPGQPAPLAAVPPPQTITLTPEPADTVTETLPAETVTAPPETVTAPPETVTAPPETVTLPAETVTVEVEAASSSYGIMGGGASDSNSSSVYYANCSEAKAAGAAPIRRGEPGYRSGLDRDNDGIACER